MQPYHSWNQIHIAHVSMSDNTDSINVLSSNGTILFQNSGWATKYAYYNGSWQQPINASEINFDLAKSYIIEMDLHYMETYAPLAAFYSHVIQRVIMDENYQPRLIVNMLTQTSSAYTLKTSVKKLLPISFFNCRKFFLKINVPLFC